MPEYVLSSKVHDEIYKFYTNVAKKYQHTYDYNDMWRDINKAYDSIYQIENGLLRRNPTISRWQGLFMATSQDKRWNFAYRIDGETIYVEDACHSQNMHESRNVIRMTESQSHNMLVECVSEILKKIV